MMSRNRFEQQVCKRKTYCSLNCSTFKSDLIFHPFTFPFFYIFVFFFYGLVYFADFFRQLLNCLCTVHILIIYSIFRDVKCLLFLCRLIICNDILGECFNTGTVFCFLLWALSVSVSTYIPIHPPLVLQLTTSADQKLFPSWDKSFERTYCIYKNFFSEPVLSSQREQNILIQGGGFILFYIFHRETSILELTR